MHTFFWVLAGVALLVLLAYLQIYREDILPKKRLEARKRKERWGELVNKSHSGECWKLSRYMLETVNGKRVSSVPYLESLQFKFLGYVDAAHLWVEPPAGWTKKAQHPFESSSSITDATGSVRFKNWREYWRGVIYDVIEPVSKP